MPKDMFTEVRDIFFDLAKYVFEHPTDQGRALLDRYEKTLLNNDVLITSKRDVKNNLNVNIIRENNFIKIFRTELALDRAIDVRDYQFRFGNNEEEFKKYVKDEFVAYLERGVQ